MDVWNVLGQRINLRQVHHHFIRFVFPIKLFSLIILDSSKSEYKKQETKPTVNIQFRTLTQNIHLRRNANIALNVPSKIDFYFDDF